jgi:hypothetical protein
VFEIQSKAFFGTIKPRKTCRHAPDRLIVSTPEIACARALDLDDAGAKVGELASGKRGGNGLLERDNDDSI